MKLLILILGAAWLVFSNRAIAADVIAAENMVGGWQTSGFFSGVGYAGSVDFTNESSGQRFIPHASGNLTRLDASIDRWRGGESLRISIHNANGIFPGSLLGSILIPESQVIDDISNGLTSFNLAAMGVQIVANQPYVFTFRTATAISGDVRYRALLTATNTNSFGIPYIYSRNGGTTWQTPGITNEVGIRVFVAEVPEPSAATGLTVGLIACLLGRKRHNASARRDV